MRSTAAWATSTSPGTATPRRAAASPSCASTISGTRRTRWTRWTGRCWTAGSSACRWPATAARPTRTTAAAGRRPAGTAAAATAAAAAALEDAVAADLEAGAALGPAVGPATVDRNPGLAHALGLAPPPSPGLPGDPSQSPHLSPDPGPGRDPGPDLEALPLPQRENPTLDPGLRALPSLRKKKELYPPRNMVMYLGISTGCMLLY